MANWLSQSGKSKETMANYEIDNRDAYRFYDDRIGEKLFSENQTGR